MCSCTGKSLSLLLFLWIAATADGFLPRNLQARQLKKMHTGNQLISLHASLRPFVSSLIPAQMKDTRENQTKEEEELRDEDFLLMPVKPKILNHERDFFRQSTRVQAWDEYVLVSILCTSISYNALQSFELNPDHEGVFLYEGIIRPLVQIVSGSACLSGIYSTMVFSLSILYGKTALGLERDPQYDGFLENTLDIRIKAFRAFSLSLGLFAVLVVLVLAEDLGRTMILPVGAAMLGFLYIGFQDWRTLVDEATPIYDD